MRITHFYKETSKAAHAMKWDFEHYNIFNNIYSAYNKPSHSKISAFYAIKYGYEKNDFEHFSAGVVARSDGATATTTASGFSSARG